MHFFAFASSECGWELSMCEQNVFSIEIQGGLGPGVCCPLFRPPQKWKRWLSFCSFSGLDRLHVWNLEEVGTGPTFPPRKMRRGKTLKCILRGRCIRSIIFVRSAYLGSIQQYEADDRDLKRGLPLAS